jgi:hypothetical protein
VEEAHILNNLKEKRSSLKITILQLICIVKYHLKITMSRNIPNCTLSKMALVKFNQFQKLRPNLTNKLSEEKYTGTK